MDGTDPGRWLWINLKGVMVIYSKKFLHAKLVEDPHLHIKSLELYIFNKEDITDQELKYSVP